MGRASECVDVGAAAAARGRVLGAASARHIMQEALTAA